MKKYLLTIGCILLLIGLPLMAQAQWDVSPGETQYKYGVGESFTVEVALADSGADIDAMGLNFNYPDALLQYDSADFAGTLLEAWMFKDVTASSAGVLKVGGFTTTGIIVGPTTGVFVKLNFTVTAEGTGDFTIDGLTDDLAGGTTGSATFSTAPVSDFHLLVTEFAVTPTEGEFIEIYNGTGVEVDLTNYYVFDGIYNNDNDYVHLVDGTYTPYGSDFLAQFPAGATIADGEYQVIALDGTTFNTTYGFDADYELKGTSATTPDMVAPGTDYIGSNSGLTNSGELVVLFYWDGACDLVQDVDIVVWGDKNEAVDKTGVEKDGPDADTDASTYLDDTAIENQIAVPENPHAAGESVSRCSLEEVGEMTTGGNGIIGHDETSEDLATAFGVTTPTPGAENAPCPAGKVNVTFIANTATVPDTLGPNSVVQMRGDGGPLTWGGDSPVILENIEGDYWTATVEFDAGEEVMFKFYTNSQHSTVSSGVEWEHQGWEGDVATGNRLLTVGDSDTTLPLQFVNGWLAGVDQNATPYAAVENSFVVWVRVNMQGWEDFNSDAQIIGLRGSNTTDWGQTGEISWGTTYPLNQESDHVNAGSQQYSGRFFYSGAVHVPDQYAGGAIEFKVVVHNAGADLSEDWGNLVYESSLQNHVDVSGNDTTNYWFWLDNMKPIPTEHSDQVIVTWVADMSKALNEKGFAYGDTIQVRSGYFGTATEIRTKTMTRQGFSTAYSATDTIEATIGSYLDYQYYIIKNGVEYREIYYNFLYTGETTGEAERRMQDPISAAVITIEDILESESEVHRMPKFRNTSLLTQDVTVTFSCDLNPAVCQLSNTVEPDTLFDIQGNVDVWDPDAVMGMGLAINGPATGEWFTWGPAMMDEENHRMYDDGTHGDAVAGDGIFSIELLFSPDSGDVVGQEFKFGIGGGDNEGGYGNNHIENIDDTQSTFTIASQFGSIDPVSYWNWDYDNGECKDTDVEADEPIVIPDKFTLDQNFPNPFNPVTTISYKLPEDANVTLKVYNMMGHEVKTLVGMKKAAGIHNVEWDGTDNLGNVVSTGLYMYKIEAGNFKETKKMMLMK